MTGHRQTWLIEAALLTGLTLVICLHAVHYFPYISDDALISLRYVDRFLDGKGLTWTDGRPVEGYSNLLWILLIAAPGAIGVDLIDAARLLGIAGMSLVVYTLLHRYLGGSQSRRHLLPLGIGLFFFCTAAPVAVWAIAGLEQSLLAALIALSIPLTIQVMESDHPDTGTILRLSIVLGLICLTRPDGPLFTVAAFLSVYVGRYLAGKSAWSLSHAFVLGSFPFLFYGGQLMFRVFYYGEFLPNTALVKISPGSSHFESGWLYVLHGFLALVPFSIVALVFLVAALFSPSRRSAGISLLMIAALWTPYVVFIGGDIFPAHRHIIPLIVVFTFAVIEGTDWILSEIRDQMRLVQKFLLGVSVAVFCGWFISIQFKDPDNKNAVTERWEWDGKVVGLLLKGAFSKQQPLIAVTAAGCLPYWSELPALDMLGLNDYYLPRHPPQDFGKRSLGHELGNGAYVLQRQPDIVIFHTGFLNDDFRSGFEMQQTTEFRRLYTPVNVKGTNPYEYRATLWVRKYSPRIGIQHSASEIRIPGFLLNRNPRTIAYAGKNGRLVVPVCSSGPASVEIDSIRGRDWNIHILSSPAGEVWSDIQQTDSSLVVTVRSKRSDTVDIEELVLTERKRNGERPASSKRGHSRDDSQHSLSYADKISLSWRAHRVLKHRIQLSDVSFRRDTPGQLKSEQHTSTAEQ
ncbi:MAG TPA: hypothetical protein VI758_02580 [Bacteroidota bacterium]